MPPSFSKIAPNAADKVMQVPQVWCVSIGSSKLHVEVQRFTINANPILEYVVTYTQLTTTELCEETVLIGKYTPIPDQVVQNWHSGAQESPIALKEEAKKFQVQNNNRNNPERVDDFMLFEGKRVEDFEVNEPAETHKADNVPIPRKIQKASTWNGISSGTASEAVFTTCTQQRSEEIYACLPELVIQEGSQDPPLRRRSAGSLRSPTSQSQAPPTAPVWSIPTSKDGLKSMSIMLSSVDEPEMTMEYMETFQTCLASLLKIWPSVISKAAHEHEKELQQIQQSVQTAEKIHRVLVLEETNPKFAMKPEYRTSLMNLLGLQSVEQEVTKLGSAVKTILRLVRESGTKEAQRAFLHKEFEGADSMERRIEDLKDIARRSFLAWPWINNGAADQAKNPQDAALSMAENLIRILQDNDDHIRRRKDVSSYLGAVETTLPDLDALMKSLRASFPATADGPFAGSERSRHDTLHLARSMATRNRKEATVTVVETLVQTSKDLVELFIPCNFSHAVLSKIWGSLASLSRVRIRYWLLLVSHAHANSLCNR